MASSPRHWKLVDHDPAPLPEFAPLVTQSITHEVDLETLRYDWTAGFINEDPWAESSSSQATRNYQLQRLETGWRMRLIGRNHSTFDTPEAWEDVPAAFGAAWDRARETWQRRPR